MAFDFWRSEQSGKMLGLVMTATVVFIGAVAAPVSAEKTTHAAGAEGVLPSVIVGASGTEKETSLSTGEDETEEGSDEVRSRIEKQMTMWISSFAEGLNKVQDAASPTEPTDNSHDETLYTASLIGDSAAQIISENHTISYTDYSTLLNIVEAECTGGDEKSKLLVANVILNRVKDEHFPDNVYDVVWQKLSGTAQFSPTQDGRMGTLKISDTTISAVNKAVEGEDISKGALFFMAREYSSKSNVDWFDEKLTYLFSYGGHDFYKFN